MKMIDKNFKYPNVHVHPTSGGIHPSQHEQGLTPILNQTQSFLQRKSGADTIHDASDTIGERSSPHTDGDTSN
jgi:hypothetical protein